MIAFPTKHKILGAKHDRRFETVDQACGATPIDGPELSKATNCDLKKMSP
jgi:hypothetical protein